MKPKKKTTKRVKTQAPAVPAFLSMPAPGTIPRPLGHNIPSLPEQIEIIVRKVVREELQKLRLCFFEEG